MNAVLSVNIMATSAITVDISKYAVFIPQIISRDIACGGPRFTTRALSKKVRAGCRRFNDYISVRTEPY